MVRKAGLFCYGRLMFVDRRRMVESSVSDMKTTGHCMGRPPKTC